MSSLLIIAWAILTGRAGVPIAVVPTVHGDEGERRSSGVDRCCQEGAEAVGAQNGSVIVAAAVQN